MPLNYAMKQFVVIGILRILTGLAQFGSVILLAAWLSLESLGEYSLLAIYLTYAAQIAGLNFYTYAVREQSSVHSDYWPVLLQRQWLFLAASVPFVCVLITSLQALGAIQLQALGWFIPLVALSVINTQHENFLIGAGRPIDAALSLLARTSWVAPIAVVGVLQPEALMLESVLASWVLTELGAAGFVLGVLARRKLLPKQWFGIDWPWLARGLQVGAQYTVLGLMLIVSFSVQRVLLGQFVGEAAVGIFHFLFVISVFGPNLLEASLFAILLPRLISAARAERQHQLQTPAMWTFALLNGFGAAGLIGLFFVLPLVVSLLGKEEILPYVGIFPILGAYSMTYTAARVLHYNLYAAGADRWVMCVNASACAVACVTSVALIPAHGIEAAAWSLLLTGMTLLMGNILPFWNKSARRLALRT